MTPILISESTTEPISVNEAGFNLHAADDGASPPTYVEAALIARNIKAARKKCEEELGLSLVAKTLEISAVNFYVLMYDQTRNPIFTDLGYRDNYTSFIGVNGVYLPGGPVRSIVSVNYLDANGVDTVMPPADYRFSRYARVPLLIPNYGKTWPSARVDLDSVRIRYTAGFPSTDSPPQGVPEPILAAMHLLVAHLHNFREAVHSGTVSVGELPLGVRYLLSSYRTELGV